MIHYLYKITNKLNNKYYIGIHSTSNVNDGYLGSGTLITKDVKKYGAQNFEKEIIKFLDTREEAFKEEAKVVTQKLVNDPMCYNISLGGVGSSVVAVFDEKYKYVFVPNSEAINKWSKEIDVQEQEIKKKVEAGKFEEDHRLAIQPMIARGIIKMFPAFCKNVTTLYNHKKTNKQAVRLLTTVKIKGIFDCISIKKQPWDSHY